MDQARLNAIIEQMTLEEKASLCSGSTAWLTEPVERLGVPAVWMSDGPHGLRKEKERGGTNIMRPAEPATCFPCASATACSWDEALIGEIGGALAQEARALKVTTLLGPGVNIKRSPLCGRNFEYLSEDPFLAGRMAAAYVRGVENGGVGTSLKHFCANNQETLRMSIDARVDERALREIYLAPFEHVVKHAHPKTVMTSYNRLNGTYLSDNRRMIADILRGEWGFDGLVMSDWGGTNDRVEGIRAGLDLEMPANGGINDRAIVRVIQNGLLTMEELDRVVMNVLCFAFEAKEKEGPGGTIDFAGHHALARRAASSGAVLLKNEGVLPLTGGESIAVVGALAQTLRYQGGGSSHINPPKTVSFLEAMKGQKKPFAYAPGYELCGEGRREGLIGEACRLAEGKDVVLAFIGLTDEYESEGFDRAHMRLPRAHDELMTALCRVNRNVVAVIASGAPVELGAWEKDARAVLSLGLGGQAGGEAALDVLYGAVNPSGKLAETWPLQETDNIVSGYFPMGPRTVEYRESIYVGYRYFDAAKKPVRYPFGYGLSYTRFEYSDLQLSAHETGAQQGLTLSFTLKNCGTRAGAEVVQLYVAPPEGPAFRPQQELKGFRKVFLEPGEQVRVDMTLDARAFSYFNTEIKSWHAPGGAYEIRIGASSRDIRLADTVRVESDAPDAPMPDLRAVAPWYYDPAGGDQIPAAQFAALYGEQLPSNAPVLKGEFDHNSTVDQIAVTGVGRAVRRLILIAASLMARGTENPQMIVRAVREMPLRALSSYTGGAISPMAVDGLAQWCNGQPGGVRRFFAGFRKKNR